MRNCSAVSEFLILNSSFLILHVERGVDAKREVGSSRARRMKSLNDLTGLNGLTPCPSPKGEGREE
jgi:hypothetical protein